MKATIVSITSAIALFTVTLAASADIIAGPITNPGNGHDYYLLTPNFWSASETEAEQFGGTLVVVNSVGEQEWVFSTFGAYCGTNRNLWIGLRRQWQGGPMAWVTDEKVDYANWSPGQPDNAGGVENSGHMLATSNPWARSAGGWNDASDDGMSVGSQPCGVVEVPGKSNEKALTEQDKSLVGIWYENGNADRPCWFAGAGSVLFAIDPNRNTSRVIFTTEGDLFAAHWKQHAEIVKEKILWSKGSWWSRKPAEYRTGEKSSDKDAPQPRSAETQ